MEPCRFDMGCWRPLCLFRHSGRRATRWIAVWRLLAEQEEEFSPERIGEQTVDVQVPQIAARDMHQERISEHTQNIDVPVTQIIVPVPFQEEIIEVIKPFQAERISERTVEQIVDMPVPQIQEQIVEVAKTIPQERISERIVVQTEDVSVPQILKEVVVVVKAVKTVPQDRIPETICGQIVDALVPQAVDEPVPPFQEEIDETLKLFPVERIPERTVDHIVDVPVPQILNVIAEVGKAIKIVHQERISGRICEQIDDDLVPQRVELALDDFVTLLTNSGIPVSSDGIWDVIDGVVPKYGTCISWHQQVQVAIILDRHVACRSLLAKQSRWSMLLSCSPCRSM